jgi:protein TonB
MFESVAPETFAPASRKLFYESLPLSIAAHAMIAAAFVVAATWEVAFPQNSPHMSTMYTLASEPTPPPPPPAPVQQATTAKPIEVVRAIQPDEIVAPTVIPDQIPDVQPLLQPVEYSVGEGAPGVPAVQGWTGPSGNGEATTGGEASGVKDGAEGGVGEVLPPNTILVKRYQSLPMSLVPMSMVYPFYPEEARLRGWEDAVAVRYVIGTDGRARNVQVLEPPQRAVFEKIVVKAIRNWRFRPLKKNGIPQEVIHELVVYFKLQA